MDAENANDHEETPDTAGPAAPPGPDGDARSEQAQAPGSPDPHVQVDAGGAGALGVVAWVWRTIVVLACVTLVLAIAAISNRPEPTSHPAPPDPPRPPAELPDIGPATMPPDVQQVLRRRMLGCLCDDGRTGLAELRRDLHHAVETDFRPIYERRIPEFLDWHYSVVGQYTELGLAAANRLEREVTRRLFGDLDEGIRQTFGDATEGWAEEMRTAMARCIDDQVQVLDADEETRRLRARMLEAAIPEALQRFMTSVGLSGIVAAGTGLAGAASAATLIKSFTTKLVASVAAKTAGKAAGKGAGTFGGAAAGAGAGATLGPVGAAVGGIVGGLAGWLGVDVGAVKLDEHFNRDQLERDLKALVDERRSDVREAVSEAIEARLQAFDAACGPRDDAVPEAPGRSHRPTTRDPVDRRPPARGRAVGGDPDPLQTSSR